MTLTIKIGDAKTRLSELIARVEAGERVIIARGETPVVELRPVDQNVPDPLAVLAAQRERRAGRTKVDRREIKRWIEQGRR